MQELLAWSKFNNASTCLCTSILVIEAIDHFLQREDHAQSIDLGLYQACLIKQLANFGIDPRGKAQENAAMFKPLRIFHSIRVAAEQQKGHAPRNAGKPIPRGPKQTINLSSN